MTLPLYTPPEAVEILRKEAAAQIRSSTNEQFRRGYLTAILDFEALTSEGPDADELLAQLKKLDPTVAAEVAKRWGRPL